MLIDKPVTTISSKSEKKAFDDNELAKVIAYMNKNTQGMNVPDIKYAICHFCILAAVSKVALIKFW